jgi:hypothetical protein
MAADAGNQRFIRQRSRFSKDEAVADVDDMVADFRPVRIVPVVFAMVDCDDAVLAQGLLILRLRAFSI